MEGVVENFDHSSQLLFVFKSIGDICIKMLGLVSGIEKCVWGESGSQEVDKQDCIKNNSVSSSFVAGTQNLFYFHLSLLKSDKELFCDFYDFTVKCGKPILQLSLALQEMSVESVEESWYSRTKQFLLLFTVITEVPICVLD